MVLITHAIVGAAVANIIPNHPVLGFSAALASHYFLDMIPHDEYDISGLIDGKNKGLHTLSKKGIIHLSIIGADFLFGIIIAIFFFAKNDVRLYATILGILGGVLPDFLQLMYLKFKSQPWKFFQNLHDRFHTKTRLDEKKTMNIVIHASVACICILIFVFY